jgi:hydrogenase maturation protease
VLGLGNPILSDDGLGIKVARLVQGRARWPGLSVMETSLAGLDVLEALAGFEKVIIIDAVQTGRSAPGRISRLTADEAPPCRHCAGAHDVDLFSALALGKKLGLNLPKEIVIFGVEALDVLTLCEECTPEIEQAIPACAELVLKEIAAAHQPTVLIVDDEQIVRDSLCDWLCGAGCRAVPAVSAEEALIVFGLQKIDLLVTDYKLPGIDGLTLLKEVQSRRPGMKSVIMTAYPSPELESEADRLNSIFLTKPVQPLELEKLVQEAVAA